MRINLNPINRFTILAALCLFTVQFALAQKTNAPSAQQIAAKVDEYMNAAVKIDAFSGSVLVARDGQPIISKGYGMANIELNVANTPQTVFRVISVTKQFTAMAIMMLQERGKLSVNDPICKYLDDCPATWQPITIHQLLIHTSGIPSYTGSLDFWRISALPMTASEFLARIKPKPLEFAPGEKFKYNNSGWYLLGLIIERTSGKSYAEFLQENVFSPLEMKQTGFDDTRRIIKNRAAGYRRQGNELVNAKYNDMTVPYSAGGLHTTTEDLLLWDKALYTEKLVSAKSRNEMFTPFKDGWYPGVGFGYGWFTNKWLDHKMIGHSGDLEGFRAMIARFPAERVTVIVLSNNESVFAGQIARDLAAVVFGAAYKIPQEFKTVAVDPKILQLYVGEYQAGADYTQTVTLENGKMTIQRTGFPKREVFAESETRFNRKDTSTFYVFERAANGSVTRLVVYSNQSVVPAQKIK